MKIAIIVSNFTPEITQKLCNGAKRGLAQNGHTENDVEVISVPGSFELAPVIQRLIDTKKYSGFIALGCVIKGETEHFTSVCEGVTYGLQKVSIENRVPVMNGVLMCNTYEQAVARSGEDAENKGYQCALGVLQMIELFSS